MNRGNFFQVKVKVISKQNRVIYNFVHAMPKFKEGVVTIVARRRRSVLYIRAESLHLNYNTLSTTKNHLRTKRGGGREGMRGQQVIVYAITIFYVQFSQTKAVLNFRCGRKMRSMSEYRYVVSSQDQGSQSKTRH